MYVKLFLKNKSIVLHVELDCSNVVWQIDGLTLVLVGFHLSYQNIQQIAFRSVLACVHQRLYALQASL